MKEDKKGKSEYISNDNETAQDLLLDLTDEELEKEYDKVFGKTK